MQSDHNNQRPMPYSEEAEQHVLSCCMLDGSDTIAKAIIEGISEESFYLPANKVIWSNIVELYATKPPVTVETLTETLAVKKQLDAVGGLPYLVQISGKIPTTAHAAFFIEKLRENKTLRDLINAGTRLVEKCYTFNGGLDNLLDEQCGAIAAIQSGASTNTEVTIQDAASLAIEELKKRMEGKSDPKKLVRFGWSDIDRIFSPMSGGELVIIAARPSVGKTSLSDQIALFNALKDSKHVSIFSLEEKTEAKPVKFAQTMAGLSYRQFDAMAQKDKEAFLDNLLTIKKSQYLHVFYRQQSLASICARIRALHRRGLCDVAIIDYLHLMNIPGHKGDRIGALSEATRTLKLLANELSIVIVVLSQLNRASARDNREPQLYDLRDSGSIEQDADRVILIHRPDCDPLTNCSQDITDETKELYYQEIIQAKGRSVGTFRCGMYFRRPVTRFEQIKKQNQ